MKTNKKTQHNKKIADIEHSNDCWWTEQLQQEEINSINFMLAIDRGDFETVRANIELGMIDVNRRVNYAIGLNYPLQLLCRRINSYEPEISSELIELLLLAKADVNLGRYSPLDELCDQTQPNLQLIQRLVEFGAKVVVEKEGRKKKCDKKKGHNAFHWLFKRKTQDHVCVAEYLFKYTSLWKIQRLNVDTSSPFFSSLFVSCFVSYYVISETTHRKIW